MLETVSSVEFHEIHEYVRHEVGTYFSWFTFFLTILFGAMGWSLKASLDSKGVVRFPAIFNCMLFLFMVQIGLAIAATDSVMNDVIRAQSRSLAILQTLTTAHSEGGYKPGDPVPSSYVGALRLARDALIVNLIFWPLVGLVVYVKFRGARPLMSTPDDLAGG